MEVHSEEVRERAYRIWETEGRPHGRDLDHWLQAEREVSVANERSPQTKGPNRASGTVQRRSASPRARARKAVE
jgi:hypothetical protein